jgi:hypothetical protein
MLLGSSEIVRLDHVACALALDDDASLGGVAAAAAAVDQEAKPAAHVGRRGIQVALQTICVLWKWSNRHTTMRGRRRIIEALPDADLALTGRIVVVTSRLLLLL